MTVVKVRGEGGGEGIDSDAKVTITQGHLWDHCPLIVLQSKDKYMQIIAV